MSANPQPPQPPLRPVGMPPNDISLTPDSAPNGLPPDLATAAPAPAPAPLPTFDPASLAGPAPAPSPTPVEPQMPVDSMAPATGLPSNEPVTMPPTAFDQQPVFDPAVQMPGTAMPPAPTPDMPTGMPLAMPQDPSMMSPGPMTPEMGMAPAPAPMPSGMGGMDPMAATQAPMPMMDSPVPPQMPAPRRPRLNRTKKIVATVAALLFVAVGGALAYVISKSGGDGQATGGTTVFKPDVPEENAPKDADEKLNTSNKDVVTRSDGKLDLTTQVAAKDLKNQIIKGKLNQQFNCSDGLSFMVTKSERNFTNPTLPQDPGMEYVKLSMVVGSRASTGTFGLAVSTLTAPEPTFLAIGANGTSETRSTVVLPADISDALYDKTIGPGQQVSGDLYFKVKSGEKISLERRALFKADPARNPEDVAILATVTLEK